MPQYLTPDSITELKDRFEDDVRFDYGGRGMYGKTCVGYTGEYPFVFAAVLAKLLTTQQDEDDEMDADTLIDVIEGMPDVSIDSMGRGTIYYWPGIRVEGSDNG
jgi:hypothetical protein